ncbi:hypothetical protein NO1_1969, partial [Candidatus Termititenax aidoneus]
GLDNAAVRSLYFHKMLLWPKGVLSPQDKAELKIVADYYAWQMPAGCGIYDFLANPPVGQKPERPLIFTWEGLPIDTGLFAAGTAIEGRTSIFTIDAGHSVLTTDAQLDDVQFEITVDKLLNTSGVAIGQPHYSEMPTDLKDLVLREVIKRDIWLLVQKHSDDTEKMQEALIKYIDKLPDKEDGKATNKYQMMAVVSILFLDGGYTNRQPNPPPIPIEAKRGIIQKFLDKISFTTAGSGAKIGAERFNLNNSAERAVFAQAYQGLYGTLWSGYKLMLYKEAEQAVTECLGIFNNQELGAEKKVAALTSQITTINQKLADLLEMIKIIKPLIGLTIPQGTADNADLIDDFRDNFSAQFYFNKFSWDYMGMLADILNNLFWLGYDLSRVAESLSAGADYVDFYQNLMEQAVILGQEYQDINAAGWQDYYKLRSAIERIRLQQFIVNGAADESLLDSLVQFDTAVAGEKLLRENPKKQQILMDALRQRQVTAKGSGQLEEYAYYRAIEAFLCTSFVMRIKPLNLENDSVQTGQQLYEDILNDSVVKQYDYIYRSIQNMKLSVDALYGVSSSLSERRLSSPNIPNAKEESGANSAEDNSGEKKLWLDFIRQREGGDDGSK